MAERAGSADPSPFLNHSSMAYRLERVGRLSEAEQVAREIWESNSAAQGQNSEEALSDQAYYSWLLMRNGNYQEAEELSLDALARSSEALGKDHDITTSARSAAAAVHIAQGKVGEARELYGRPTHAGGDQHRTRVSGWVRPELRTVPVVGVLRGVVSILSERDPTGRDDPPTVPRAGTRRHRIHRGRPQLHRRQGPTAPERQGHHLLHRQREWTSVELLQLPGHAVPPSPP